MNKNIAVVGCVHGNEPYGMEVGKQLPSFFSFFLGNTLALSQGTRFVDTDLNRCFPGKANGNYEERVAHALVQKLRCFDYVIDLHSTPEPCPLFGIITSPNEGKLALARMLGLQRVVIMSPSYASGRALIDHVTCGISLEVGSHDRKENVRDVLSVLETLQLGQGMQQASMVYRVFSHLSGKASKVLIRNFERVRKGDVVAILQDGSALLAPYEFVPILVGVKTYSDVLCLACEEVPSM